MTAPTTPGLNIDDELSKKLKFVLMAVLIYRVGAHIAAPMVDVVGPLDRDPELGLGRALPAV